MFRPIPLNGDLPCTCCAFKGRLRIVEKMPRKLWEWPKAIDDIRMQLVNNRIDTEELKERLQAGIADPLRIIADEMFPELERRLESLQSSLEDAKLAPAARDKAKIQADAILLSMQHVLDRMIELQDYNEMVEMLRDIIKMQEQLRQQTEQRNKQKIRDLLKE